MSDLPQEPVSMQHNDDEARFAAMLAAMTEDQLNRMLDFAGAIITGLPVPVSLVPQAPLSQTHALDDTPEE